MLLAACSILAALTEPLELSQLLLCCCWFSHSGFLRFKKNLSLACMCVKGWNHCQVLTASQLVSHGWNSLGVLTGTVLHWRLGCNYKMSGSGSLKTVVINCSGNAVIPLQWKKLLWRKPTIFNNISFRNCTLNRDAVVYSTLLHLDII